MQKHKIMGRIIAGWLVLGGGLSSCGRADVLATRQGVTQAPAPPTPTWTSLANPPIATLEWASANYTCALRVDGDAQCWGEDRYGPEPVRIAGPFLQVS